MFELDRSAGERERRVIETSIMLTFAPLLTLIPSLETSFHVYLYIHNIHPSSKKSTDLSIYICIYKHTNIDRSIDFFEDGYIYIYIERERERARERDIYIPLSARNCVCIVCNFQSLEPPRPNFAIYFI